MTAEPGRSDTNPAVKNPEPLLVLENVWKTFPLPQGVAERISFSGGRPSLRPPDQVNVINGVNLSVIEGETLCLVGESGCGKSTLARIIMRLIGIDQGKIHYRGTEISGMDRKTFLPFRSKMQMIFQNPFSCLNPRLNIQKTLEGPLKLHFPHFSRKQVEERIAEIMDSVGLDPSCLRRYPHEFSGGQRQRIGIARALAVSPEFIIADEPISALDISIQSQILNLLKELQRKERLTYLFITHNLGVVKYVADRVCIMYLGVVCEIGTAAEIFANPRHPYTQTLLSAVPDFGKPVSDYIKVAGEVTSPINLPAEGCVFADRCPHRKEICARTPDLREISPGVSVACHLFN